MKATNTGFQPINGNIEVTLDPLLTFESSEPMPTDITGNTFTWSFTDLAPFHTLDINMVVQYPGVDQLGEMIVMEGTLLEVDDQVQLDQDTVSQAMVCSYDPNDKQAATTGESQNGLTLFQDALDYLIRFENTGNDTAFNVVIRDTLDIHLDPNTFVLMGSSHPVEVTIRDRAVAFRFPDILLPWTDVDSIGSQGFVKYRVKAKAGLPDNTLIENTAHIYFDFNPPIITNTTRNELVESFNPTSTRDISLPDNDCLAIPAPNPFHTETTFRFENRVKGVLRLFNAWGKKVLEQNFSSGDITIERKALSAGVYYYQLEGDIKCAGKLVIW